MKLFEKKKNTFTPFFLSQSLNLNITQLLNLNISENVLYMDYNYYSYVIQLKLSKNNYSLVSIYTYKNIKRNKNTYF